MEGVERADLQRFVGDLDERLQLLFGRVATDGVVDDPVRYEDVQILMKIAVEHPLTEPDRTRLGRFSAR